MLMLPRLTTLFSITSHAKILGVLIVALPSIVLSGASTTENEGWTLQEPLIELPSPVVVSVADDTEVELAYFGSDGSFARKNQNAEREPNYGTVSLNSSATVKGSVMDEVDQYLWAVYERSPTKRDSTGDFTWKDAAAASRLGMPAKTYVIGGMDPDLRELLYHAGLAMDAAGIHWTILSAFRDDYRQTLASGFKAHTNNSLHGGSVATGGYGHGCAIDITDANGNSDTVWQWLDRNSARTGLQRLLPRADPAHVQPRGTWHGLAVALRNFRLGTRMVAGEQATVSTRTASTATMSERESDCVNLRHWKDQTMIPTSRMRALAKVAVQKHTLAEKLSRSGAAVTLRGREPALRTVRAAKLLAY
jgi:hypothetical protein